MIDKENGFVFVHIPKTAGQSVHFELNRVLNLGLRNSKELLIGKNEGEFSGPPHLDHCSYLEIMSCSGASEADMSQLFKFTFVRDPVDRALSIYKFLGSGRGSFNTFVKKELLGDFWEKQYYFVRPQAEFVVNQHGELALDYVGRIENLAHDWKEVKERIGVRGLTDLPHRNNSAKINFKIPKDINGVQFWLQSGLNKARRLNFGSGQSRQIDGEIKSILFGIYEKDYDLFRY